jgi:hypothetical protein
MTVQQNWTMISVTYSRIPGKTCYHARMYVMAVVKTDKEVEEYELEDFSWKRPVEMAEIIEKIHWKLGWYKTAKVTMIQEPTQAAMIRKSLPRGCVSELDQATVDLIRDDVEKAMEMFRPIERRVCVSPQRVSLNVKEIRDGNEPEKQIELPARDGQ